MKRIVYDIETTALDPMQGDILCLSILEDKPGAKPITFAESKAAILKGLDIIRGAEHIIGHNIVGFDNPYIEGWIQRNQPGLIEQWKLGIKNAVVHDTMVLARLVFPDQKERDFCGKRDFPTKLIGKHSLKAWGYRLGHLKGDLLEEVTDFSTLKFSEELAEYNRQDCVVTLELWKHLLQHLDPTAKAVLLEHRFADVIRRQMERGFRFDISAGHSLTAVLMNRKLELTEILQRTVPPKIVKLKTKTKTIPFNPGSRDQIAAYLMDQGWKPEAFTPSGKAQVDESILSVMPGQVAKDLCEYLTVAKRLGQLADGEEAWLKAEKNGRIHGYVNTNGAVTGRCTHSRPNIAQVPASNASWGKECRRLFRATEGMVMLGCDASGLELRCLAHYLAAWDSGEYANIVCNGDVHTKNQQSAGLPTRNDAKSFIYAFLYGAGDAKIGSLIGGNAKAGKKLKQKFLDSMPALKKLRDTVAKRFDRGYLIGIDGRKVWVRSKHAALNTLLQSAGAIAVKQATVLMDLEIRMKGYRIHQVAHIHDEIQFEGVREDIEKFAPFTKQAFQRAGETLGFRCPLDGEFRIGSNWSETH
jgi:DNA polymerase-1